MFSGTWIPLVTPFHDDRVDMVALRRLVAAVQALEESGPDRPLRLAS
ncbi:hypothetical protein [Ralstonia sp. UBA689]|nr:hypothetical protein [Ralstonia sp. UBA689]